ncbi:toxin Cry1Ac domain D-VI-related protein [Paenibacillus sp. GCM10027626]|uniref:toxin Cry1Ac domain D-VI-related protein n=1 Tax=Paenibacillus sp. GCM10027626 TaxID=3273411 RepID=UPI00362C2468
MNLRERLRPKETKLMFIIALICLLSLGGIVAKQPVEASERGTIFSDIEPGSEYEEALTSLVQQKIIFGYSDGTYRTSEKLIREQAAVILARALQLNLEVVDDPNFQDVNESSKYYKSIAAIVSAGIFQGYSDGTFKPDQSLTRAEMAKILVVAYQLPKEELVVNPFKDVSSTSWYAPYLTSLIQNKITTGTSLTTYSPNDAVNRGEMALFIYRCQQLAQQQTERIIESEVTTITSDSVQLGNESFTLTDDQKTWITPENLPILKKSRIKAQIIGGKISRIESVTLYANGLSNDKKENRNVVLTGNGAVIDATVIIKGDNLSIKDATITKDLMIESDVQNSFYLENVLVKGSTILSKPREIVTAGTNNSFDSLDIKNSHKPKLHFHNSILQSVKVALDSFTVKLTGDTKTNEIDLLADASIEADASITIPIVRVGTGSLNTVLNVRIDSLFIENMNSRITLRNDAKIEDLRIELKNNVKSIFIDYETIKHKIIRINGVPNIDLQPYAGWSPDSGENSNLIAAKNAVAWLFSDSTKTALKAGVDQTAIDDAKAKVNLVADGAEKSALGADLQLAQQLLTDQLEAIAKLQAATEAVNGLFTDSTKTALKAGVGQAAIDDAKAKVNLVADGAEKSALGADLQLAQQLLTAQLEAIAKLQAATEAVNGLFTDSTKTALKAGVDQAAIDDAKAKVNLVADGAEKSALGADLQLAQQLLTDQLEAIAKLQAATEAVNGLFADSTKTALKAGVGQAAIDDAKAKMNLVADGAEKSALGADLQLAQQLLTDQLEAIAKLQAATEAVNGLFADSTKTALKAGVDQAAIDDANAKVALVADGAEKSALMVNLQLAQQLLTDQLEAIANLQAATEAVNGLFADSTKTALKAGVDQAAIDDAKAKVDLVADGAEKSALKKAIEIAQDLFSQILAAPTLTGTAPNVDTVRFTFSDDAAWRDKITGVYQNGNSVPIHSSRVNRSTAGIIEINLTGASLRPGTHEFLIKAEGYVDAVVTIEVPVPLAAPTLTGTTPNVDTVRITFADDAAWRDKITGVYQNGNSVPIHSSRVNRSTAGIIEINLAGASLRPGTHEFLIKAEGYADAAVTVEVAPPLTAPILTGTAPNVDTVRFTFTDDTAWRDKITGVYLNGNSIPIHSSRVNRSTAGIIEIDLTDASLRPGTHEFLIKAERYEDVMVVITSEP